jgi:hypothetical protein
MASVNASFALGKLKKSDHLNGQAALKVTAFQGPDKAFLVSFISSICCASSFEKFSTFQ